ncbi:MAG: LysM peptidoglycan-binding domain-containing protein, partial [Spirochaetales bacterium]|nr:LysM peptidoglycan-binding domain-containing protein [Spirochaetales bacterium]
EDLQLDDLEEEDLEIDMPGEELSLDDDVEDMQLDDFGDEDLEIDMVGDELSLDNDIDQNLDLDSEELSLDDEDFDFDDLEEDSLEVEDFDMEVDDEELFDESSENITEDEFEKTSDSVLEDEDEDDYTPGILSESETVHKKEKEGGNPLLIALLVIIAIAAIAGISYLLFRSLQGEDSPALEAKAGSEETVSEVEPEALLEPIVENAEESTNGEQPKDDTTAVPELAVQESTKVLDSTGVWYKIRWGDTLWGISYSFYDSPRDFNEIVKENKIKNPDIIFAETEIFIPSR